MSKILANQIANYGDDSPIEIKEGLNIPIGKPLQAAGVAGGNGQVLTSTGTSVEWTTPFDGDYDTLTNKPTIPAAQVRSDWNAIGTVAEILNKPPVPPLPSVTVAAAGGASLSYNSANGLFTYTPPDLSSFATTTALSTAVANSGNWDIAYGWGDHAAAGYLTSYTETDPIFGASVAAGITNTNVTNWNTAYGWGDHSTQGYITGLDIEDLGNVDISGGLSDQQVLKWDSASSSWLPANDLVGGASGIALADLSVSTTSAGSAALSYNNSNGVFTFTPPDLSGYLTSVAINDVSDVDINNLQDTEILRYNLTSGNWENWTPNYLTSYTETDPVFAASPAASVTLTKINQWDTAYGWGNHANGGYLVATNTDKTNWDTAYGWGDHAGAGYLTSYTETDTLDSVTGRGASTTNALTVGGVSIGDDDGSRAKSLTLGDDNDLTLYYDGSVGYVTSYIESDQMIIRPKTTPSDTYIDMIEGGPVRLYHGSSTRISTSATGAVVSGTLTAGGLTYPNTNGTSGDVLTSDGTGNVVWAAGGSGGGANVTISDTAPGSAQAGDLWWESDKGRLKIYYNDTDSTQWVDASPPLTNSNVPLYVGELELYNFGTQVQWTGNNGVTVSLRTAEGGGGFQSDYIRVTFPTAFSSVNDYTVQATVYDAGVVGHIYGHSIRRTNPQYFDILIYNLTSSANATQASVAVAVYAI